MLDESFKFYYKAVKLKDMLRQGAVEWRVKKDRMESIAEHCFGCSILAISLQSELNFELDLGRVLEIIAIHELEELFIGDITPLDNVDKNKLRENALIEIKKLVEPLKIGKEILNLTNEFNNMSSNEAEFAKAIDKLECVLEFKKYQDIGQVSLSHVTEQMLENKYLKMYVDMGKYDLSDIFFLYHMPAYEKFGINEEYWFNTLKNIGVE